MKKLTKQTKIAARLGISINAFRRLVEGKLGFELIDGKRCYDYEEVLKLIRAGRSSS